MRKKGQRIAVAVTVSGAPPGESGTAVALARIAGRA